MTGEAVSPEVKFTQILGKLGTLEALMKKAEERQKEHNEEIRGRVRRLENCPCSVHRDPAHTCVVLDIRDALEGIRLHNSAELTEFHLKTNDKLNAIQRRMAFWGGGLAVVLILLEVVTRLLPLIWR